MACLEEKIMLLLSDAMDEYRKGDPQVKRTLDAVTMLIQDKNAKDELNEQIAKMDEKREAIEQKAVLEIDSQTNAISKDAMQKDWVNTIFWQYEEKRLEFITELVIRHNLVPRWTTKQ